MQGGSRKKRRRIFESERNRAIKGEMKEEESWGGGKNLRKREKQRDVGAHFNVPLTKREINVFKAWDIKMYRGTLKHKKKEL